MSKDAPQSAASVDSNQPATRKSKVVGCSLCERGFPLLEPGWHFGTQSLGMIPTTRCQLSPKGRVLAMHPKAFCEPNGPYFQVVAPMPYGKVTGLGMMMRNRRAAWADADRALNVQR